MPLPCLPAAPAFVSSLAPPVLTTWLSVFRPCFTAPVWNRILVLVAGAVLAPGKRIGAGELWAGVPARKLRDMPADERARNAHIALHYQDRAVCFRTGLRGTR